MSNPATLARIHAACFTQPPPWSADAIAALLDSPGCFLLHRSEAFLIGRIIADEAELLTLAVSPTHRRQGLGRELLEGFEDTARSHGASTTFLEVAEDNFAAIHLYEQAGWAEIARRPRYYGPVTALILQKQLV